MELNGGDSPRLSQCLPLRNFSSGVTAASSTAPRRG